MTAIADAAAALRDQFTTAGTLGPGMILTVTVGYAPPPAGKKIPVIDVVVALGYPFPDESASGYDSGGAHYRVRTWVQAPLSQPPVYQSLST